MTGECSFWPAKSPFWPDIVHRAAVILSPVMARSTPHTYAVDPFTTEYMMASGKVALTLDSVDEILKCNHSNETSFANCWLC